MPQETLQWLADPANLNTDLLPSDLETHACSAAPPSVLQEPLQWLVDPANLNTDLLPSELEAHACSAAALHMPQETLQWLADPANLNTDLLPPGLETYDPLPFLSSTGNVFMVTLLPQVGCECGCWVAMPLHRQAGVVELARCVAWPRCCRRWAEG